jgi:hypothetical protein
VATAASYALEKITAVRVFMTLVTVANCKKIMAITYGLCCSVKKKNVASV